MLSLAISWHNFFDVSVIDFCFQEHIDFNQDMFEIIVFYIGFFVCTACKNRFFMCQLDISMMYDFVFNCKQQPYFFLQYIHAIILLMQNIKLCMHASFKKYAYSFFKNQASHKTAILVFTCMTATTC